MRKSNSSLKLSLFSGFHDPDLDRQFQSAFQAAWEQSCLDWDGRLEVNCYPMWLGCSESDAVMADQQVFIGFSAGVIRAAIAAQSAKLQGQPVVGLIAIDGWGVPLCDRILPTYRWSHDLFTHTTSPLLGGAGRFFADPPIDHLSMWTQVDQVQGWYLSREGDAYETSAINAMVDTIYAWIR